MSDYYNPQQTAYGAPGGAPGGAQNLQFYQSSYSPGVPGQATPQQASFGFGGQQGGQFGAGPSGFNAGFGAGPGGVSGRMGEQGGLRTGWIAAFSTEGYDGEPPLIEELGINPGHIKAKTLAVLNPFRRIDQHLMDDSDLAGPVLFFLLMGTFLLFSGKVHFGFIYGLALLGSTSLHIILSLMSPTEPGPNEADSHSHPPPPQYGGGAPAYPGSQGDPHAGGPGGRQGHFSSTLTFARSSSILGYCLLPLVVTSLVGILMPMNGPLGIVLTSGAIVWSTYSASGIFCVVGRLRGMRALAAYPLALFYVGFGIMSIFSSRVDPSGAGVKG